MKRFKAETVAILDEWLLEIEGEGVAMHRKAIIEKLRANVAKARTVEEIITLMSDYYTALRRHDRKRRGAG